MENKEFSKQKPDIKYVSEFEETKGRRVSVWFEETRHAQLSRRGNELPSAKSRREEKNRDECTARLLEGPDIRVKDGERTNDRLQDVGWKLPKILWADAGNTFRLNLQLITLSGASSTPVIWLNIRQFPGTEQNTDDSQEEGQIGVGNLRVIWDEERTRSCGHDGSWWSLKQKTKTLWGMDSMLQILCRELKNVFDPALDTCTGFFYYLRFKL